MCFKLQMPLVSKELFACSVLSILMLKLSFYGQPLWCSFKSKKGTPCF